MGAEPGGTSARNGATREPGQAAEVVALALGSNQGPSESQLADAIRALGAILTSVRVASLFRTRAVSPIRQPDYLNTAVVGRTRLSPDALLATGKALERLAGRRHGPRFGPRPLDIDLLLYGDLERGDSELTLPHPRLRQRRFYLAPLAEIAARLAVPPDGATVGELLAALPLEPGVERVAWSRSS